MTGLSTIRLHQRDVHCWKWCSPSWCPLPPGLAVLTMPIMAPLADLRQREPAGWWSPATSPPRSGEPGDPRPPPWSWGLAIAKGALCALAEVGGPLLGMLTVLIVLCLSLERRAGMNADRHGDNNGAWGSRFL